MNMDSHEDIKVAFVGKRQAYTNVAMEEDEKCSIASDTNILQSDGYSGIEDHAGAGMLLNSENSWSQKYHSVLHYLKPFRFKRSRKDDFPLKYAGFISYITAHWIQSTIWTVFKTKSGKCSMHMRTLDENTALINGNRLSRIWDLHVNSCGLNQASLGLCLWRFVRTRIFISFIFMLLMVFLALVVPTFLFEWFLSTVDAPNYKHGLVLILVIFCCTMLRNFVQTALWTINYETGSRARSAVLSLLYSKLLRLRFLKPLTIEKLGSYFVRDADTVFEAVAMAPMLLTAPIMLVLSSVYLVWYIGPVALVGLSAFVLNFPYQTYLSKWISKICNNKQVLTSKRMKYMKELISNMAAVKMQSFEKPFYEKITDLRKRERNYSYKAVSMQCLLTVFHTSLPVFAAVLTLVVKLCLSQEINPVEVFVMMCTFATIRSGQYGMPLISRGKIVLLKSTLARYKDFLSMEEFKQTLHQTINPANAVEMRSASFTWESASEAFERGMRRSETKDSTMSEEERRCLEEEGVTEALSEITLEVAKGKLVGVCGPEKAGKSSLLSALLCQMVKLDGEIAICGNISYVPEKPFHFDGTIRDNIIFGQEFQPEVFDLTLKLSGLWADVQLLPSGDLTEIGHSGLQLTYRQKLLLSLARALYADGDVILFDDILSQLESSEAERIFDDVILEHWKNKTVILVTNQVQILSSCNSVLFLRDGHLAAHAKHSSLMESNVSYQGFLNSAEASPLPATKTERCVGKDDQNPQLSPKSPHRESGVLIDDHYATGNPVSYFTKTRGFAIALGATIFCCLAEIFMGSSNFTLAEIFMHHARSNHSIERDNVTHYFKPSLLDYPYAYIFFTSYGTMVVMSFLLFLISVYVFNAFTQSAANILHMRSLERLLKFPISFFDVTPLHLLFHIFSADTDEIDIRIPLAMKLIVDMTIASTVCIATIVGYFMWFCIPMFFLILGFFALQNLFRFVMTELKRADDVLRGPLLRHVINSVNGCSTVHAFKNQEFFIERFRETLDSQSVPWLLLHCSKTWMHCRMDLVTSLITVSTLLFALFNNASDSSFVGIALFACIQLATVSPILMHLTSEIQTSLSAIRRAEYIQNAIDLEGLPHPARPPRDWPGAAALSYQRACLSYRPGLPVVLRDVTLNIRPGETIGIFGPNGAGKTSLTAALFRLVELQSGFLEIDGTDVRSVDLFELRKVLEIVTEDSILFSGTIRYNLDPLSKKSDDRLWEALDKCRIKEEVKSKDGRLNTLVENSGFNLRQSERKLIILARALINNSKIIFVDGVSGEEEDLLEVLKTVFRNITVLMVCRSLTAAAACDRVAALNDGKVIEFDTPANLNANQNSFYNHFFIDGGNMAATNKAFSHIL